MSSKLNGMKTGLALFTAVSMSALITAGVLTAEDPAAATETSTTETTPATQGALQTQKIWEREHTLRDGRTVTCLYVTEAGLECDWDGAR